MRCRGLIALLIWGQSVAAADLGTWGDLWPVKEPDMLTVIMQRLTALEQSGEMGRKMDAFKERVIRNSLRPPAVPGIGRTEKYGSRLFDPSVRLAADIRDNEGRVFVPVNVIERPIYLLLILFRRSLCRFTKSRQAEAQVHHASR